MGVGRQGSPGPDAVVLGGGINGLVAANLLARSGRRVALLERRPRTGGLAAPREVAPGFLAPGVHHDTGRLAPAVIRALGLERAGLRLVPPPPLLVLGRDGGRLVLEPEPERAAAALESLAVGCGGAYRRWRGLMERLRPTVRRLVESPPPRLPPASPGELWKLAVESVRLRRLGRQDLYELLRLTPMAAADWLADHLPAPLLREAVAARALMGDFLGPWSPGTAANVLLRECCSGREVAGGPAALAGVLEGMARQAGVEVHTGAEATEIAVDRGRVRGVLLGGGETLDSDCVVAACSPREVVLSLLPPGSVPLALEEAFRHLRCRGAAAKVHLAVEGPVELSPGNGRPLRRLLLCGGSPDDLERAFDAAKYRQIAAPLHLDVRVEPVAGEGARVEGHTLSALLAYVPRELEGGWSVAAREGLLEGTLAALEPWLPRLRRRLVGSEVLAPPDLEKEYRLPGGHLRHGEEGLDQLLFMRPTPATARYRGPLEGLFLASSGCHPGGGVTGLPGMLAARAVLASD